MRVRFAQLIRKPAAWLPLLFSAAIAALLLTAYLRGDLRPKPDEDAYAHLFQIFLAAQIPIIAWFAIKWMPQAPRPGAIVLILQFLAIAVVCSPVYLLHL
jgi:hypothetical protein